MPQMPTPGPRKPPSSVPIFQQFPPPKPAVKPSPLPTPSPTPTRQQPTQEEWAGIQAQQRSSTGPQHRRYQGSYEKQKQVDTFSSLNDLKQSDVYKTLTSDDERRAFDEIYHEIITRNTTQYKSDSTAGQQGDERAQDRTAQREARIQGNRNLEYVRRGMGLSGQPEYATDTRWESQSRPGNVLGNVLNNSMLGQGIEAITGQAPFRTGEAQGMGEQAAELGGSVITGLAEFGGMGALGARLGGGLARAALGRAVTPAFAASELAAPLIRGVEGLAANIAGNMVPQIPGISNAVGRGDLTPQEGLRAIGGSALSGAAMGPVARLMPGNTLRQMLGRNAMQTAVGTADQFAQGQTPDAQSLLVDFGSGALLDARDVKINRPSWMKQVDPMRPQDTPASRQALINKAIDAGEADAGSASTMPAYEFTNPRLQRRAERHQEAVRKAEATIADGQINRATPVQYDADLNRISKPVLAEPIRSPRDGADGGGSRQGRVLGEQQLPEQNRIILPQQGNPDARLILPNATEQIRPQQAVVNPPSLPTQPGKPIGAATPRPDAPQPGQVVDSPITLLERQLAKVQLDLASGTLKGKALKDAQAKLNGINKKLDALRSKQGGAAPAPKPAATIKPDAGQMGRIETETDTLLRQRPVVQQMLRPGTLVRSKDGLRALRVVEVNRNGITYERADGTNIRFTESLQSAEGRLRSGQWQIHQYDRIPNLRQQGQAANAAVTQRQSDAAREQMLRGLDDPNYIPEPVGSGRTIDTIKGQQAIFARRPQPEVKAEPTPAPEPVAAKSAPKAKVKPAPKAKVKPAPKVEVKAEPKPEPAPAKEKATKPAPTKKNNPPKPPVVDVPKVEVNPEPAVAPTQKAKPTKATKPEPTPAPTKAAKPAAPVKGEPAVKPDTPTDGDTLPTTGRDKLKKGDLVKTKYGDIARIVKRSVIEGNVYYDLKFESGEYKGSTEEEYPHNLISAKMTEMGGGTMPRFNTDDVVRLGDAAWSLATKLNNYVDPIVRQAMEKAVLNPLGIEVRIDPKTGERTTFYNPASTAKGAVFIRHAARAIMAHIDPKLRKKVGQWFATTVKPKLLAVEKLVWDGRLRNSTAYQYYIAAKQEANQYKRFFSETLPKLAELSSDDLINLNKALTGDLKSAEWDTLAKPIRDKIDELSMAMLDVGMLSQEMYDRGAGSYLRRMYEGDGKNDGVERDIRMANRVLGVVSKLYLGRGKWVATDDVTTGMRHPSQVEKVGTRTYNGRTVDLYKVPFIETYTKADGTTGRRKVFEEMELRGDSWWRDYTPEERAKMGEKLNAAQNIGNTLVMGAKNLETGRFYDLVSKDKDHAIRLSDDLPRAELKAAEAKLQAKGWHYVTPKSIGKSSVDVHGKLSGMWVSPEVHQFMMGEWLNNAFNRGPILGWVNRYIIRPWKVGKTALNLSSHVTNAATNLVQFDMHDADYKHVSSAFSAVMRGKGSAAVMAHLERAQDLGAFEDSMAAQELSKLTENGFDLSAHKAKPVTPKGFIQRVGQIVNWSREVKDAGLKEGSKKVLLDGIGKLIEGKDAAKAIYGKEDDVFRFALYLDRIEKGQSPEQAALAAREGFVNYDIHAPLPIIMKNSFWPFISYVYRAIPLAMKMYKNRPWKAVKHAAYLGMFNAIGSIVNAATAPEGATTEDEERASMEWGWFEGMTKLRTPFRDDKGGSRYWDVSKYFPLNDVAEMNDSTAFPLPIPKKLMPTGPLWMPAEFIGNEYDAGYGPKEITNKAKTRMDQAGDFYEWVKRQAEPGVAFQAEKLWKVWNGQKTQLGQDESVLGTAANAFVKLPRVEPQEQIQMRARALKAKQMENAAIIRDRARQIQRDGGDRSELKPTAMKYNGLSQQMARDFGEYLRRIRAKREQ